MKNLKDILNESLSIGAVMAILSPLIIAAICLVETFYYSLKPENQGENSDHSIKGLLKHDGIVTGFIEWLFERFGDLHDLLQDRRIRKEMDKIEASDSFKEYLKLPKSKRTLKKLREIGKEANIKNSWAVLNLWDMYKKDRHVTDSAVENEINESLTLEYNIQINEGIVTYNNDFASDDESKLTQNVLQLVEYAINNKCKILVNPDGPSGWPEVTLSGDKKDVKTVVTKFWGDDDFNDFTVNGDKLK